MFGTKRRKKTKKNIWRGWPFVLSGTTSKQVMIDDGISPETKELRTHEKVIGVGTEASNFEEFHEVPELTMDVSTYLVTV
jgi:hypothetical protein